MTTPVSDPDVEIRNRFISAGADPMGIWILLDGGGRSDLRIVRPDGTVDGISYDDNLRENVNSFSTQERALETYGPGAGTYPGRIISHEAPVVDDPDAAIRQLFFNAGADPMGIWILLDSGGRRVVLPSGQVDEVTRNGDLVNANSFSSQERALRSYGPDGMEYPGRIIQQSVAAPVTAIEDPDAEIRQQYIDWSAPAGVWVHVANGNRNYVVEPDGTVQRYYSSRWQDWSTYDTQQEAVDAYVNFDHGRIISQVAPRPANQSPDLPGAEEYITKAQLQIVMRDLAIENNWCSDHHRPMRELGVQPLGVDLTGELVIRIPTRISRTSTMRDLDEGLMPDLEDLGFGWTSSAQARAIKQMVTEALNARSAPTSDRGGNWHFLPENATYEVTRTTRNLPEPASV